MSNVEDNFQIFIALPTDDVCTVKGLFREMLVYELKSRVELKAGIPGDIFNLFFMNAQLLDKETLKTYNLKHGCIVRVKLEQNWIGLFEACWRGDIYDVFENGVQFLDEEKFQGYNISLWNKLVIQRATHALFIACHRGYLGLVLELINRGATNINGKTIFGRSALHVAAYQGFVGCVSLLLSEGAICNQIDIEGKTALAVASENGHAYCERRLWLYQWNLQTFQQPSRSWSGESSESSESDVSFKGNGGYSEQVDKLPSTRRTVDHNNNNNNNNQEPTAIQLHLPRVTNNDDKRQHRQTKSHEPPRSPFPLMQIAERYRKELRDYNKGAVNLPTHAQKGSKERAKIPREDLKAPEITTNSTNEAEIVSDANNNKRYVGEIEKGIKSKIPSIEERSADQAKENKDDNNTSRRDTEDQLQDNRHTVETSLLDQERPASERSNGIRKLDILMTETRAERLQIVSSSLERDKLLTPDRTATENEPDQEEGSALIDFRKEYSCKKPAQTFEDWLQMKRSQEKSRPSTALAQKSRLGKSMDPECFKKWLSNKRHQRIHSNSESSSTNKKTFISSGGLTFERWLETKLSNRPFSAISYVTESRGATTGACNNVRKQVSGKPFQLWLAEKKSLEHSVHNVENINEQDIKNSRTGIPFQVWLQEKQKQKQIELVQKITTEKEQQRLAEIDQLQKWLNPRYKTFEDWLQIKDQEARFERLRALNEPQKPQEDIPVEEKQKDAKVVYDIWHTMKALQELSDEEKKYKEMKAKWAVKQREIEQLRTLHRRNIINRARKYNSQPTSAKS